MRVVRFGIVGGGLMGKELASAAARWMHIDAPFARPEVIAICDVNPVARKWFMDKVPTCGFETGDYKELLAHKDVDAIYCAVPHDLHAQLYEDIIRAGKHLLGEKPFGIDKSANDQILSVIEEHPDVFVRSSSEFPFFPGVQAVIQAIADKAFGDIIAVRARFLHASDLNPNKPINWKRMIDKNGAYGCMGDLGLHVMHIPMRFGWEPRRVAAQLTKIIENRPNGQGGTAPCETWDNAAIHGMVEGQGKTFSITFEMRRIAPGHMNSWEIEIDGTARSMAFSTKNPKNLRVLDYESGGPQDWKHRDMGYSGAYKAITGGIFEFGFPDSLQQMTAAFLDELVNGRERMTQPFYCATPEETAATHRIMTAALENAL